MFASLYRLFQYLKIRFLKIIDVATGFRKNRPYKTLSTEELPDHLDAHTIYVLGEGEYTWAAAILCPCGCGAILQMSLHKEGRPRWEITLHTDGTASLSPSINRLIGCKSHFFFKQGYIKWCK